MGFLAAGLLASMYALLHSYAVPRHSHIRNCYIASATFSTHSHFDSFPCYTVRAVCLHCHVFSLCTTCLPTHRRFQW
mgnify:CR=1 FL=1